MTVKFCNFNLFLRVLASVVLPEPDKPMMSIFILYIIYQFSIDVKQIVGINETIFTVINMDQMVDNKKPT
jgi:hypothetical protein